MALGLGYVAAGFILAGFSEVFTVLYGLTLATLYLYTRQRKFLVAGAGLALGFAVVYLAPGNAVRSAALHHNAQLIPSLSQTLQVTGLFLASQVIDHLDALLLAFCVGYLCPLQWRVRKLRWVLVTVLCGLGLIYVSVLIVVIGTGGLDARHFTDASLITVGVLGFMGAICGS